MANKKPSGLIPQPHGGALRPGAGGGPQPGSGRPPSELRRRMRVALEERLGVANEIIDDESAKARDRLGALAFLARIGLGGKREGITVDAELLN